MIAALSLILLAIMLFLNLKKQKSDQLSQEKAEARLQEILASISKSQSDIEIRIKEIASQSQLNHQDLKDIILRNFTESNEKANAFNSRLETSLKEFASQTSLSIEKNSQTMNSRIDILKEEISKLSSTLMEATSL
jgi:polyhydroxyalkanoate synthesis regulator phasin